LSIWARAPGKDTQRLKRKTADGTTTSSQASLLRKTFTRFPCVDPPGRGLAEQHGGLRVFCGTPWPLAYQRPRKFCASAFPWAAALRRRRPARSPACAAVEGGGDVGQRDAATNSGSRSSSPPSTPAVTGSAKGMSLHPSACTMTVKIIHIVINQEPWKRQREARPSG
jgi:hypothetical protein